MLRSSPTRRASRLSFRTSHGNLFDNHWPSYLKFRATLRKTPRPGEHLENRYPNNPTQSLAHISGARLRSFLTIAHLCRCLHVHHAKFFVPGPWTGRSGTSTLCSPTVGTGEVWVIFQGGEVIECAEFGLLRHPLDGPSRSTMFCTLAIADD